MKAEGLQCRGLQCIWLQAFIKPSPEPSFRYIDKSRAVFPESTSPVTMCTNAQEEDEGFVQGTGVIWRITRK